MERLFDALLRLRLLTFLVGVLFILLLIVLYEAERKE